MMIAFISGLSTGFSLILAIGAQNAFVLKQGLKRQYVFWVCLICALSDAVLIYLGVTGFSKVVQQYPAIVTFAKYFGALFLFMYGLRSFYAAYKNQENLNPSSIEKNSLLQIIGICLALTWLNPHVYLDTLVLMGAISVKFSDQHNYFALGAILSSCIFFFALGYGAKLLLPLFKNPYAWKVLDVIVGVIMWMIAASLLL